MPRRAERRKYRRFEIPGGMAKIGKLSSRATFRSFSEQYPLLNICVGGVNILCSREYNTGEYLLVELQAPDENAIRLGAKVIWSNSIPISNDVVTGFELLPFGEGKNLNSNDTRMVLRRLYARYTDS